MYKFILHRWMKKRRITYFSPFLYHSFRAQALKPYYSLFFLTQRVWLARELSKPYCKISRKSFQISHTAEVPFCHHRSCQKPTNNNLNPKISPKIVKYCWKASNLTDFQPNTTGCHRFAIKSRQTCSQFLL